MQYSYIFIASAMLIFLSEPFFLKKYRCTYNIFDDCSFKLLKADILVLDINVCEYRILMWLGFPKKIVFLHATNFLKNEHNLSFGNNKISDKLIFGQFLY